MGYYKLDPDELAPMEGRSADARSISEYADLETVGIRTYDAAPGEQLPLVYHYHDQQEEAFYVLEGILHVETPEKEFIVEPDEIFLAKPDHPHRAYNPTDADDDVKVLAIGAPSVDDAHEYEP